jgi:hypothetical protein
MSSVLTNSENTGNPDAPDISNVVIIVVPETISE